MTGSVGLHSDCADAILNAFRHNAHDVTAVYVMLHTGLPGADLDDNISVADDSLKLVNFSAPTGGSLTLSNSPTFTNDSHSETLTHVSLWDGAVGPGTDNPLWAAALTSPQAWVDDDTYTLTALGLVLTPIAAT